MFDFIALPTSSKQKLQALAKDELLASLNVPLTENDVCTTEHENEVVESADVTCADEDHLEKNKQAEKERRETKRLLIMDEILETEKNYICCLETLNEVGFYNFAHFLRHPIKFVTLYYSANYVKSIDYA